MTRLTDLAQAVAIQDTGKGYTETLVYTERFAEIFGRFIVQHASECVRDVLREENSGLSYQGADEVQKRLKDYFEVTW